MKAAPSRAILYLLASVAVASVAVFAASALRNWRGTDGAAAGGAGWAIWAVGVGLVALLYLAAGKQGAWEVGTREVVYMAIGAALYGVLSWPTNYVKASLYSLVSLRPAVAIPLFMAWVFGPIVGFFCGAMGNILGDFLTGWGVYPAWDLGNGLMGLVVGLARPLIAAGTSLTGSRGRATAESFRSASGPRIMGALLASGIGVIIGMGIAAASSIYINRYTPAQAFTIDFLPAASTDLVMALIFLPMLLRAWEGVQGRRGR